MKKTRAHRPTPECVDRPVAAVVAYLPHAHTPVQGRQHCAADRLLFFDGVAEPGCGQI